MNEPDSEEEGRKLFDGNDPSCLRESFTCFICLGKGSQISLRSPSPLHPRAGIGLSVKLERDVGLRSTSCRKS